MCVRVEVHKVSFRKINAMVYLVCCIIELCEYMDDHFLFSNQAILVLLPNVSLYFNYGPIVHTLLSAGHQTKHTT